MENTSLNTATVEPVNPFGIAQPAQEVAPVQPAVKEDGLLGQIEATTDENEKARLWGEYLKVQFSELKSNVNGYIDEKANEITENILKTLGGLNTVSVPAEPMPTQELVNNVVQFPAVTEPIRTDPVAPAVNPEFPIQ